MTMRLTTKNNKRQQNGRQGPWGWQQIKQQNGRQGPWRWQQWQQGQGQGKNYNDDHHNNEKDDDKNDNDYDDDNADNDDNNDNDNENNDDEADNNDGHSVSKACWPMGSIRGVGAWRIIPGLNTLQTLVRISISYLYFHSCKLSDHSWTLLAWIISPKSLLFPGNKEAFLQILLFSGAQRRRRLAFLGCYTGTSITVRIIMDGRTTSNFIWCT